MRCCSGFERSRRASRTWPSVWMTSRMPLRGSSTRAEAALAPAHRATADTTVCHLTVSSYTIPGDRGSVIAREVFQDGEEGEVFRRARREYSGILPRSLSRESEAAQHAEQ